jgi:hypothetical protein
MEPKPSNTTYGKMAGGPNGKLPPEYEAMGPWQTPREYLSSVTYGMGVIKDEDRSLERHKQLSDRMLRMTQDLGTRQAEVEKELSWHRWCILTLAVLVLVLTIKVVG